VRAGATTAIGVITVWLAVFVAVLVTETLLAACRITSRKAHPGRARLRKAT
jgi:hypothetical protein